MTDFGLRAPHGPDMSGDQEPLENMDINEKGAFDSLIRPDDSYTPEGIYWADLPLHKKAKFVLSYDGKEAARELGSVWNMFKADPLSPVSYYFKNMVLPGAGLGLEGYVIHSLLLLGYSFEMLMVLTFFSWFTVTSFFPLGILSRCFNSLSLLVGRIIKFAARPGLTPLTTWRFLVLFVVRFWLAFLVTGMFLSWSQNFHSISDSLQARSSMGSYPRCGHYVARFGYAYCRLGYYPERLGYLLCLGLVRLRHRCG